MAQIKTRRKWWKTANNKWIPQLGTETQVQAQARFAGNQSIAVTLINPLFRNGSVDENTIYRIGGWAMHPSNDYVSVNVDIWINGVIVATVAANQVRQDVADYYGIIGFNNYQFSYIVPPMYQLAGATLKVTLQGDTVALEGTPTVLTGTTTTTTTFGTTTTTTAATTSGTGTTTTTTTTTTTASTTFAGSLDAAAGTQPSYALQIDTENSYQSNENYLKLEIAETNLDGLIRFVNNAPQKNPDNGKTAKYHIDDHDFFVGLDNRWFEPFQPILIEYYWGDNSVPNYAWKAVGQGTESYFKAYSIIQLK